MSYSKTMKTFAVMSQDDFRQMTLDIASGAYRPSPDAPRKVFCSFSGLAEYARKEAEKEKMRDLPLSKTTSQSIDHSIIELIRNPRIFKT